MSKKKKDFNSELHLTTVIFDQLCHHAFEAYKEVPMLGRSIDLVLLKKNKIISIEFKMNDWKRAVKQAKDYQLASDYVYICMPRRKTSDALIKTLKTNGIGLLFPQLDSEWPFEEIVKAKVSQRKWRVAHKNLKTYLHENRVR